MEALRLGQCWFSLIRTGDTRELWRPELEIVFLLQGTGRVYSSDLKTAYALRETDIFVINSFEVQEFELDAGSAALSFSVSPQFINNVAPELLTHRVNCRSFLYADEEQPAFHALRQDLARAFQMFYKRENDGTAYAKSGAAAVLEDLGRYFLDRNQRVEYSGAQESLQKITQYVQHNYRQRVTLDELAKYTFLSKTYISRIFTRYLGISFTGYLELLRLSSATQLIAGQGTLEQIAQASGFPNVDAMTLAFKRHWGVTPGEYRRTFAQRGNPPIGAVPPEEGSELFASLLRYAGAVAPTGPTVACVRELTVDTAERSSPIPEHWKRLLNVGYARSLTDAGIQGQLRRMQERVGFEFFRLKGILDDDMCLLRLDMNGNPVMNYAYLDEGIDFILSLGAKPMLEVGFMPGLLAKDTQARSMRGSLVSAPKEISRWRELVELLMAHFVERYGGRTVALWLFSPWISPDFIDMGFCSREEYARVYSASYHAIRAAVPNALIVGPGSTSFPTVWPWYLEMCRSEDCMPDILSFRAFAIAAEVEEDGMKLVGNNESFPFAVSGDEDYLAHMTQQIRTALRAEGMVDTPLILEEWSNNIWQRDLCNDTCYKSAYLFKNILENNGTLGAMGYFALNDRLDEIPPSLEPFHGGFGLFTQDGIPKSACLAMEQLAHLGGQLLYQDDGCLVPNIGETGKYIYVIITYNLVTTFLYTMINIPYGALTSLMTRDQDQRTVINIFRMFMAQVGSLIINAFTLPFINAVGGSTQQRSWIIVSVIYGVAAAALFLACFAMTKERVQISSQQKENIPLGESFRLVIQNNYWLIIVGVWVFTALGMGMGMSVGTYYAKYILGDENLSGFLSAISLIPVLVCMPLVAPLSKKFGKRNVALVGSVISIVGQAAMLISPRSFSWLIVCNVIKGVGQAALMGTLFAMVADTIEYGQWKTGKRVEGMLYSSTTFGAKIGAGVGMAIALAILGSAGYDGMAAVQTEAALSAIENLYLLAPLVFLVAMPILYWFYKLDKIYPQVMKDLEEREQSGKL